MQAAPINLAELQAPLPSVVLPNGRTIALRHVPASALDAFASIEKEHGVRSWQYMRALLAACAEGITDDELAALSLHQAMVLVSLIMGGIDAAQRAIKAVEPPAEPSGEHASGNGAADDQSPRSSADSDPRPGV